MIRDWLHSMSHSPVCQILCEILHKAHTTEFPPAWTSFDYVAGQFYTLFSPPLKNVLGFGEAIAVFVLYGVGLSMFCASWNFQ